MSLKHATGGALGAALLGVILLIAWSFWWEPAGLANETHTLKPPGWPASCDGLRVAVLADLHTGSPFNGLEKLREVDSVTLTIAGHTHGGQVNLPLVGRMIVPSQFGQRYAAGLVVENNRHLFVSTGIGTSILPVRFRVPPEISVLVLEERDLD